VKSIAIAIPESISLQIHFPRLVSFFVRFNLHETVAQSTGIIDIWMRPICENTDSAYQQGCW
jgi:hypothetical protein